MQTIYHSLEERNWLYPQPGKSSQGGGGPRKDSKVTPSHDLETMEQGAVPNAQKTVVLAGPLDFPREDFSGHEQWEFVEFGAHRNEDCLTQSVY